MFLGGLSMMALGVAMVPGRFPGGFGAGLGFIYIVMAIVYIIPAVFLWMYADRIGGYLRQKSSGALASALEAQKSFWKFTGILTLIVLCLYAIIFFFAVFAGVAALR